jgi:hypothetical protein
VNTQEHKKTRPEQTQPSPFNHRRKESLAGLLAAVVAGLLIVTFSLAYQTQLSALTPEQLPLPQFDSKTLDDAVQARSLFAEQFLQENESEPAPDESLAVSELAAFGGGSLFNSNGLPLLVVRGDFFTMGTQYGYLQGERIASLLTLFDEVAQTESAGLLPINLQHQLRRGLGRIFARHFPDEARQLIAGIQSGAEQRGVTLHPDDLAFLNSLIDIAGIGSTDLSFSIDGLSAANTLLKLARKELGLLWLNQNCNTFVAFGSRTTNGKTFQTRNTDVTTGMGLERFPLVTIFLPESQDGDQRIPFVSAGFVGQIGVSTGMNAHGVALGQVWAFSNKKAIGRPWSLTMISILSKARSAQEAAELLTASGPHTYGNNFVFGDALGGAVAVELNAENLDTFTANDPREIREGRMPDGRIYALPLADAVVRGDLSLSRLIRADQTSANGPWGYPPSTSSYKLRYAGQVKRILAYERLGRKIGAQEAMVISRATASRKHGNLQNAVYANSDRKLWVAYAAHQLPGQPLPASFWDDGKQEPGVLREAFENPFIYVPFDWFLEQEGLQVR